MKGFSGFGNESPMKQNIHTDTTDDGIIKDLPQGSGYARKQKRKNYFTTSNKENRSIKQVFIDYSKAIKRKFNKSPLEQGDKNKSKEKIEKEKKEWIKEEHKRLPFNSEEEAEHYYNKAKYAPPTDAASWPTDKTA